MTQVITHNVTLQNKIIGRTSWRQNYHFSTLHKRQKMAVSVRLYWKTPKQTSIVM